MVIRRSILIPDLRSQSDAKSKHTLKLLYEDGHLTCSLPGGGGGTTYNGLYGEAPPERGTFFRLQIYEKVGSSQVEVHKKGREIGHLGVTKGLL